MIDFWHVIDRVRVESLSEPSIRRRIRQEIYLVNEIESMSDEVLVNFETWFRLLIDSVCTTEILLVAERACGCKISENDFLNFRAWLVSMGSEFYRFVTSDPSRAGSVIAMEFDDGDIFFEDFHAVVTMEVIARFGAEGLVPFRRLSDEEISS